MKTHLLLVLSAIGSTLGNLGTPGCCSSDHKNCDMPRFCNHHTTCNIHPGCSNDCLWIANNEFQYSCIPRWEGGDPAIQFDDGDQHFADVACKTDDDCCGSELVCHKTNPLFSSCQLITKIQSENWLSTGEGDLPSGVGESFTGCCSNNHRDCDLESSYCNYKNRCNVDSSCLEHVWLDEDYTVDANGNVDLDNMCKAKYEDGCEHDNECCGILTCHVDTLLDYSYCAEPQEA